MDTVAEKIDSLNKKVNTCSLESQKKACCIPVVALCCRADLILVVLVTVAVVAFKGAVVVVGRLCGLKIEFARSAVAAA